MSGFDRKIEVIEPCLLLERDHTVKATNFGLHENEANES
jgi:hypothetical protein